MYYLRFDRFTSSLIAFVIRVPVLPVDASVTRLPASRRLYPERYIKPIYATILRTFYLMGRRTDTEIRCWLNKECSFIKTMSRYLDYCIRQTSIMNHTTTPCHADVINQPPNWLEVLPQTDGVRVPCGNGVRLTLYALWRTHGNPITAMRRLYIWPLIPSLNN